MAPVRPGDPTQVVAAIGDLCKELVEWTGEVFQLCKDAEGFLAKGQGDSAMRSGAEALAKALHLVGEEFVITGASLTKPQANMADSVVKQLLKAFRDKGDKPGEALSLSISADNCLCQRETAKALKAAQSAVPIYRALNDQKGEAGVMCSIVNARLAKASAGVNPVIEMTDKASETMEMMKQKRMRELDQALDTAKELVKFFIAMCDRKGEAKALDKLAQVYIFREDVELAKQHAREQRSIYLELNDVYGEAEALRTTVNANLQDTEDSDDALTAAKDVLRLFQGRDRKTDKDDRKSVADALHAISEVHIQRWEVQEAMEAAQDALGIYRDLGEKRQGQAKVLHTQAQIYTMEKKTAEAVAAAKEAASVFQEVGDPAGEAASLHSAAFMEFEDLFLEMEANPKQFSPEQNDRFKEAWSTVLRAYGIFQELQIPDGEAQVQDTINSVIDRARRIHMQVAQPVKTIYVVDPVTREQTMVHIYDTAPRADADDEEEEEDDED